MQLSDMVRSAGHFRMFRYLFAHLRHEKQSGLTTGASELIQSVFDEGKPVVLQEIHNQTGLLTAFEQRGIRTTMPFQFGDLQQLAEDVRAFFDFDEDSTTGLCLCLCLCISFFVRVFTADHLFFFPLNDAHSDFHALPSVEIIH
jgi:hypothetical protein